DPDQHQEDAADATARQGHREGARRHAGDGMAAAAYAPTHRACGQAAVDPGRCRHLDALPGQRLAAPGGVRRTAAAR
ncbi:hypothetical protein ABTK76_20095, partial [Acinetobacter baumannii]